MHATSTASAPIPVDLSARRHKDRLRRRDIENGAITIIPRTQCIVLRADPTSESGAAVRNALQEAREDGAGPIEFDATAYRLRHSQVIDLADRLQASQVQGVRATGRVLVGKSPQSTILRADPAVISELELESRDVVHKDVVETNH